MKIWMTPNLPEECQSYGENSQYIIRARIPFTKSLRKYVRDVFQPRLSLFGACLESSKSEKEVDVTKRQPMTTMHAGSAGDAMVNIFCRPAFWLIFADTTLTILQL